MKKKRLRAVEARALFAAIPDSLYTSLAHKTSVDYNVSKLYGQLMLQLLVVGFLNGNRISTRLLAELFGSQGFAIVTGRQDLSSTRHSSIAERLGKIPSDYFRGIFEWLYSKYKETLTASSLGKKVISIDSTMVKISSALVEFGMRVGPSPQAGYRKHQIKFTTTFHRGLPKAIKLFTDQEHLSEQTALRQVIMNTNLNKGDIVTFDMGLTDRATFVEFDHQGIGFVTRAKNNYRSQLVRTHHHIEGQRIDGLVFVRDDIVNLYSSGNNIVEHPFRIVEVIVEEKNRRLVFITNLMEPSSVEIAQIYRQRWSIEVLFRILKQEFSLTHLLNRTKNGIQNQMYVALIAAILLIIFKQTNQIETFGMAKIRFIDQLIYQSAQLSTNLEQRLIDNGP